MRQINATLGILLAGFIASIPVDQLAIAGIVQQGVQHIHKRIDVLEENLSLGIHDPITCKAHTEQAEMHLLTILRLRALDPSKSRKNINDLLIRVTAGDLVAGEDTIINKVYYWTARLCASSSKTLESARQLRNSLNIANADMDLSIVDALIADGDGDREEALRLLRDRNEPDSRSVLFSMLAQSGGEQLALDWYVDHAQSDESQMFTSVGWKNWAVCMARVGKWEDAAQRLLRFAPKPRLFITQT